MIEFQTMYSLKKAERQKQLLQEMEKDKMRSSQILSSNSFIYSFNSFKFIRTTEKEEYSSKKRKSFSNVLFLHFIM